MRKGRCKLQWIATNVFILFGLIFIIIELELIKKEINTIKKQTQKGTGFFRIRTVRLSPTPVTDIEVATSFNSHLLQIWYNLFMLFWVQILDHIAGFLPWVNSIWKLYVCKRFDDINKLDVGLWGVKFYIFDVT